MRDEIGAVDLTVCNGFYEKLPELISTNAMKYKYNTDLTVLFYKLLQKNLIKLHKRQNFEKT